MADHFEPDAESGRKLRDALSRFATGITVVTAHGEEGPLGITANSFSSVSLDPPLVLWSPARTSARFPAFTRASHFAIHILGDDQRAVSDNFARQSTGFEQFDWTEGPGAVPLLEGCLARFVCVQHDLHDGGDHAIIVGRVLSAGFRKGEPLIFSSGKYGRFEAH